MEGCLGCDLAAGRVDLPGGRIHETSRWVVEHCIGPLGVGTLIVKPKRHVVHVWELDEAEAAELGPLLREVGAAVAELSEPEQVYVTLWSHAGGRPVHVHWVVQPVGRELMDELGSHGPVLQVAMFERGEAPPRDAVEAVSDELRTRLSAERPARSGS
jgi:diadenosine tetraphosphate (Ap4A) HIT family hydrolase